MWSRVGYGVERNTLPFLAPKPKEGGGELAVETEEALGSAAFSGMGLDAGGCATTGGGVCKAGLFGSGG